ncbi:MAG: WD40 repeat domain-containing protein, partial [Acidimicrobiales bacterium]
LATAEALRQKGLADLATADALAQRDIAVTESLARSSAAQSGPLSLLLGVEAVSSPAAPAAAGVGPAAVGDAASARARQALIAAGARVRGAPDRHPVERYIDFPDGADAPAAQWQSVLSLGGTRLATAEFGGARFTPTTDVPARIFVWDIAASVPTVRTLPGHADQIGTLAFADQARVLVSTDLDSEVRVWDVVTGDLLGVRASATAVVSPDGRFVLISSVDGGGVTTEVYDALEREVTAVKPSTAVYSDAVGAGSFSPDSAWAMVDTASGAALLDLAGTRGVGVLPLLGPAVTSAYPSVDPSGTIATAVLNDVFIGLFSLPDGELAGVLPFPEPVADVAWGPNGSVLAGIDEAGNTSVLRFDDVAGPDDVADLVPTTYGSCALFAPTSCNTRLSFSRAGGRLVIQRSVDQGTTFESELMTLPTDLQGAQSAASYDGTVHAVGGPDDTLVFIERNLNDGTDPNDTSFAVERLGPGGSRTELADNPALAVHEAVVAPDGSMLAVATRDGRVRVWDLVDGSGPTEAATNDSPRSGLAFDASATRLIGVGAGPHTVWGLGQVGFGTPFTFGATDARSALTDDGSTILEVDATNRIVRRNVATNAVTPGALLAPADVVEYLSWGRDGTTVYANLADGTSVVTELGGGIVRRLPGTVVTTSADGQRLAVRRADGVIDVMRRDTFAVLQTIDLSEGLPADGEPDDLDIVALAPDGDQLAAVGPAGVAAVWEVASGDLVEVLPGTSQDAGYLPVQGLAYSPDGTRLVVKTPSNRVSLYDTSDFARLASQQLEPQEVAGRVAWSADGDLVAVDGLFLFDGTTLEPLGSKLAARPSTSMRFTADGRHLMAIETAFVSGGTTYTVKRYDVAVDDLVDLACALAGRNLTDAEWDRYLGGSARPVLGTCP